MVTIELDDSEFETVINALGLAAESCREAAGEIDAPRVREGLLRSASQFQALAEKLEGV